MKRIYLKSSQLIEEQTTTINSLVNTVCTNKEYLHSLPIDDIIDFFQSLIKTWQVHAKFGKYLYLNNLVDFLTAENLTPRLNLALHGNYKALDEPVDLGDKKILFHAQPRGLTVQWLAGNVPILGLFSIFSAILTKNVCIVKVSSKGYHDLAQFLASLHDIRTDKIVGSELLQCIELIQVDRDDINAHKQLSMTADVRIAWGGKEAIEAIAGLEKNIYCEDILFGPKYSYALIDEETIKKELVKSAQRLAIDVSVFDQYACSSPHTVFIYGTHAVAQKFAAELSKQLDFVNRTMLPKGPIDNGKAMEIINIRSEYEFKGKVFSSKGTTWTVIYTEEGGLAKGCFSRVIFVKPLEDIGQLKEYNNRQKQTLTVGLTDSNKTKFLDMITLNGIDRCPNLGYATFFESPWDGMFVFDRLVRWVSIYKT